MSFIKPLFFALFVTLCLGKEIGNPDCNKGQEFWCKNITTAVGCNAFKHCVHGVWEKEKVIEVDESSVCQTCIDMVKLARDQLNSNETQEELRQVLEASCIVIPVKSLRADCDKLMDDFGSYLVDTLSSEMDPNVVCSVAGLCYNEKLSKLDKAGHTHVKLDCDNCHGLMEHIEGNIELASTKDLSTVLTKMCGKFGSYSDACSSLVSLHTEEIDGFIRNYVRARPVCSLAGVCSQGFHHHKKLIRVPVSTGDIELIHTKRGDDLPCELCQQLVKHLRDVMVANTTEEEFAQVVNGLCKMTVYKDNCDTFVKDYAVIMYEYLTELLDGKVICADIGICTVRTPQVIRPLIISNTPPPQLPIERLNPLTVVPNSVSSNGRTNKEVCAFCEYFLHFIQQEITLPSSEREITDVVKKGCSKLPSTVAEQCDSFVQTYMATFIALLAQRIDPSQVCPTLGVCPSTLVMVEYKDKPTCPLCLLAMDATLRKVQNRTETDINDALDDLCLRDVFPPTVLTECVKFVTDYRKPLIDMILAEFTSQEACVYIDLCKIPQTFTTSLPKIAPPQVGDIMTNEIHEVNNDNVCVLCEFIMTKVDNALKNKKSEEEIKETVLKICHIMPKTVMAQCESFISQYADLVLDLLSQEIDPKQVCQTLSLCPQVNKLIAGSVKKCIACELLMDSLRTIITDPNLDEEFNMKLIRACRNFPEHEISFCKSMVAQLAPQIEMALRTLPVGPMVCRRINMCEDDDGYRVHLLERKGNSRCYLGQSYWCSTSTRAALCDRIEHCQKNVWMSDKPRKSHLKGKDVV